MAFVPGKSISMANARTYLDLLAPGYPPASIGGALTTNGTTTTHLLSLQPYGTGTYVCNASSAMQAAFLAFDRAANYNFWLSGNFYDRPSGLPNVAQVAVTTYSNLASGLNESALGEWLQITIPANIVPTSYVLTSSSARYRMPIRHVLLGSNNATTWTLLNTHSTTNPWNLIETRRIPINIIANTAYNTFRVVGLQLQPAQEVSFAVTDLWICGY